MIVTDALYQGQPGEAEGKQDARPTDVGRPFKETNSVRASMWSGSGAINQVLKMDTCWYEISGIRHCIRDLFCTLAWLLSLYQSW